MSSRDLPDPEVEGPTAPLIDRDHEITRATTRDASGAYNNIFIWSLTLSAGVSGLLFGYDTGVISSMLVSMGSDLSNRPLTDFDKGIITSCTSLFALLASPLAGSIADKFGRKRVILFADVLFTVGALWQALTSKTWGMIGGRSIVGLGIGGASLVVPLYISELAPSEMRGRLVTINSLFVTGGQVVAYVIGWIFSTQKAGWRWIVGLGAVPAMIQLVALFFMPESPRWLIKVDRSGSARSILSQIYRSSAGVDEDTVNDIFQAIEQEHLTETSTTSAKDDGPFSCIGTREDLDALLYIGANRRALAIACLLQGLQQLCGFNSLMYFSGTLFERLGFASPTLTSLSIALTNFVFTLFAFNLIDRIGRRKILLYSIPFMILALVLCAVGFMMLGRGEQGLSHKAALSILIFMVVYVAAYALGMGNVPWQQSELFPLRVRSLGSSISTSVNWSSNFVVGLTFLPMMDFLSPVLTFISYAGVCALGWLCIWNIYPETMGLSLEDVSALLKDGWGVGQSIERHNRDRLD